MSNIYIQEPPTNGKVLLKTTVSDIDIELWSKEAPLACRNFIQLCMDGYYDNCIFHRLVKDFIVQTGDPTGTGFGGESIYGHPFKDEFHSRLRFIRRGLVAMANGGEKDDNGSQFFFTLESTPELQNKHTIFGKVTGKTLYNMLRLGEGDVDRNERPLYPHKIISTEILNNPFADLKPREKIEKKNLKKTKEEKARDQVKGSKNFSLLSFGDEAEEEEEEIQKISNEFKNKSKSSHDLLKNDPKLSSIPVVDTSELSQNKDDDDNDYQKIEENESDRKNRFDKVKEKLKFQKKEFSKLKNVDLNDDNDDDEEELDFFEEEKLMKKNQEIEKAKDEFKQLQKQMLKNIKKINKKEQDKIKINDDNNKNNEIVNEFLKESNQFKEKKKQIKKKGEGREEQCLDLLKKFQERLRKTKQQDQSDDNNDNDDDNCLKNNKNSWLKHRMKCIGDDEIVLARDANIRNEEDWYDIHDPRNPINKRRRNEKNS